MFNDDFVGCKIVIQCIKLLLFGDVFDPMLFTLDVAVLISLLHSKFKLLSKS